MINYWRKWFGPRWRPIGAPDIRPAPNASWAAMVCLQKEGEERLERLVFRHKPTEKEAVKAAKALCKIRNAGGDKHAFNLVDRDGRKLETLHGKWLDDATFEVWSRLQKED